MLTFTQAYTEVYKGCGIPSTDSTNITLIKRNINNGLKLMKAEAGVAYTRKEVVADLKAGQQYYTFGPDMLRVRNIRVNNGNMIFPIGDVESEDQWNMLNIIPAFAVFYPQRWFIRGSNELGVWPMPSVDIPGALIVAYESRLEDMYLDDVVGASITVTKGSQTITSSTNSFTPQMVGQRFTFTDGSDGNWYMIIGYTSSSAATIENFYPKETHTSTGTIIGSTFDIPEAYQSGPQDYAFYRYFKTQRGASAKADDFKADFLMSQMNYASSFGDKVTSQIIHPNRGTIAYNPLMVPPVGLGK